MSLMTSYANHLLELAYMVNLKVPRENFNLFGWQLLLTSLITHISCKMFRTKLRRLIREGNLDFHLRSVLKKDAQPQIQSGSFRRMTLGETPKCEKTMQVLLNSLDNKYT